MSSGTNSSSWVRQEQNISQEQNTLSNYFFAQDEVCVQDRDGLSWDVASFSAALSTPATINWNDLHAWNCDSATYGDRLDAFAPEYLNFESLNAATYPDGLGTLSAPCQSIQNCNSHLIMEHTQEPHTSHTEEVSLLPSKLENLGSQSPYSNSRQSNYDHTTHSQLNGTALPSASESSPPPLSPRASHSKARLKTLRCPNCELSFARGPDLQRHIDGIHLRIRHHCRVVGCGDNHGKGYCRPEKLRTHMLGVHGRY